MIQIQRPEQFKRAAERAQREHMKVRRYEPHVVEVTNTAKGHSYLVRFTRQEGKTFGQCSCYAGTPVGNYAPKVCKHLFAAVLFVRAMRAMRKAN